MSLSSVCYTMFLNSQTTYYSPTSLYHLCVIPCFWTAKLLTTAQCLYHQCIIPCFWTAKLLTTAQCLSIICVLYHVFEQPNYLLQPNISISSVYHAMFLNSQATYYSPISLYHLCIIPCFWTAKLLTTAQYLYIISVSCHVFEQPSYLLQPNISISSVYYAMFLNSQTTYYSPISLYHLCVIPCF